MTSAASCFKPGYKTEDLIDLLEFCVHYPTHLLPQKCGAVLKKRIKIQDAIKIWKNAVQHELTDVAVAALKFILRYFYIYWLHNIKFYIWRNFFV
jgi:hypothetical protein